MTAVPSPVPVRRAAVAVAEPAVCVAITRHLGRRGFELVEATSLGELLAAAKEPGHGTVALGLLDLHLADAGGVACVARFLEQWPEAMVVLVAPGADEAIAREALELGAAGYLLRPFGLFELDAIVARALARLEMAELRRRRAERPELPPIVDFELLPATWLHWGDERSSAGAGHGYRVARTAKAIAAMLPAYQGEERWPLEFAARAHELGRLHGPEAAADSVAQRSATMLAELGVDERVVRIVRHMDDAGGSDGRDGASRTDAAAIPLASLVLAVADRVDHVATQQAAGRKRPERAIGAAIQSILECDEPTFAPAVLDALALARPSIESMWAIAATFPEH